jgi:hypothetical protein
MTMAAMVAALALVCLGCMGCMTITTDQQQWILLKADRQDAFVNLMIAGQTTRDQEQDMLRSNAMSWDLWRDKVKMGLAAPSWLAPDKPVPVATATPATVPAATAPAAPTP